MNPCERPLKAKGQRVWRNYLGGRELDRLHGRDKTEDGPFPEEWILSTTRAANPKRIPEAPPDEGICRLDSPYEEISLRSLIEERPDEMLGSAHAGEYGASQGVLAKLIDSQVRLVVQAHPDKRDAGRFFSSRFGKTESWHILSLRNDVPEPPCLYWGFRHGVTPELWRDAFRRQDKPAMLGMMHRLQPKPGDTFMVPGGLPHAIGAGCLILEIQEPTDLTFKLERRMDFGLELPEESCHLGIGFDRMFDCFHYETLSESEAREKSLTRPRERENRPGHRLEELIGSGDTDCFGLARLTVRGECADSGESGFHGLYVQSGFGRIEFADGEIPLRTADQIFVPAACRDFRIASQNGGELTILVFRGPAAS